MRLLIGLMSGTSMDGIDAALMDLDTNRLIAGITRPYGDKAKQYLQDVLSFGQQGPVALSQLNTLLGYEFALAVQQLLETTNINPQQVEAIGSHGQTICHDATAEIPYTVQLGCAHTIAELTRITVVADFRARDLVVGGQGAPFAPIFHQAVFSEEKLPLTVVNIGGIANVTLLAQGGSVTGHDVGPGNCLLDHWIQKQLGLAYDTDGEWAATGEVIKPMLMDMQADPYFKLPTPKSLGKEYFSDAWLANFLQPHYAPHDVQATLVLFTATTIAKAIQKSNFEPTCVAICGGGVHNSSLFHALTKQFASVPIVSTKALGIDPDFMEAMMFAWLADKTINRIPLDLRPITGAKNPTIYGVIYPAGIDK